MKSNESIGPRAAGAIGDQAPAFEILGTGTTCTTDGICQVEDLGEVAGEVAAIPSSEATTTFAETVSTAENAAAQVSGTASNERSSS